ncbi:MAG TPA: gliding motility-associated C-terminal domain-containing protein [Bacteroidia bacterium]|jgi:gliding motility-associated-like protein
MKKIIASIFFLSIFLINPAKASHIAGGDLSYVCLGNNQYQINLNLFVDCLGFDPGATQTITFTSTCGQTMTTTVNVLNPGGTEISQLCPTQLNNSTCNGGSLPGMWVFNFTGTVTLAPPCDTWTAQWNVCCRNNAVLNLVNASSFGSYIEATINSVTAPCNNSPSFTSQPIPYVCQGQAVNYSYGVVETDGDSLYYSLVNALDYDFGTGTSTNLAYNPGYSASSPIPGITIDPLTGMLTFTPTTLGNFVVVVLVEEFDAAGNLIGTVMRDIQFIVQNCSNIVPDAGAGAITGMTGTAVQTGPFSIELCEGSNFTFNATFTDVNSADSLFIISNLASVLPGSVITTSGSNPLVATISWTAPGGTANTNTTFSITVNDGACPVPGQQTFVYDIQVQPRTLGGIDQIICGPQSATFAATGGSIFNWAVISGDPIVIGTNFSCNPCDNPVATPSVTTVYEVTSDLSGTCVNKDTVTVTVVPDFSFTTTQSTASLCLDQSVQFNVSGSPAGTYDFYWTPSTDLDDDSIANPTATINTAGTFTYYVNITSPFGCQKKDTVTALVQPAIRTIANSDTVLCGNQSANLSATGGTTFNWTVLSGPPIVVGTNFSCNPCANPVATPTDTTTYIVTSDLTGTCINIDTVTVFVTPDYTFTTTQSTATSCLANPIQLNTVVNPTGTYGYSWSPATYLSSTTIPNPVATITTPGTYNYYVAITNSVGCVKLDTTIITIIPSYPPDPTLSYTSAACLGDSIQLHANFGAAVPAVCGVSPVGCSGAVAGTVGAGNGSNTTTTYPAPYGNWYTSVRQQYLYTAAELNAAGITGGKIEQIDFNVVSINGISTYHNFSIGMTCTNLTSFPSSATDFEPGIMTVFPAATYNVTTGWNAHPFTGSFEWDGISNVIVQVCFSELNPGSNYTNNCITTNDATTYVSTIYSLSDSDEQCSTLNPFPQTAMAHPQIRFHHCGGTADTANFTYLWSPNPLIASPTSQSTGAFVPGDTTYTLVVTDNMSGCADTSTISVIALPPATFTLTVGADVTVCPGTPTTLSASGASTYVWSPAATLSNPSIANPVATTNTTTTYTVTANVPCAPTQVDSITVNAVNSVILNVDAGSNVSVCPGASTTLNATGATSYTWSPATALSSTTIANPVSSPMTTITYTVTGTAACADPVSDVVTVTAANSVILTVDAGEDITACPGVPNVLTATGATNYTWSPATALSNTTGATTVSGATSTITYTVTGTAACADPVTDSVTVNVLTATPLVVTAGPDGAVCVDEPLLLNSTTTGGFGGNVFNWSIISGIITDTISGSNQANATVMATQEGVNMYEIMVMDLCGNFSSDTVIYEVTNDCQVIIPNVFTPNGDGINDEFKVKSNGLVSYSISIFNRWGHKVFESTDQDQGWNGSGSSDGTYFYILKAKTRNETEYDKQGYIQLLSN